MRKLVEYCLNPTHPRGGHKARVFSSALGITAANAEVLRDALLANVRTAEAVMGVADDIGQRYRVDFSMAGPRGQVRVRSVWIIETDQIAPRLVTCYVLQSRA